MTDIVTSYLEWFKSQFKCVDTGSYTEITTAFLDRHNDKIQIYAIKTETGYVLTDLGETLSDLQLSGLRFEKKRKALLEEILNGFGVIQKDNELTITAEGKNQALRMNNLIQAILSVNDLFYLAQPSVPRFFLEDVSMWLDTKEIRFSKSINITGKSTFSQRFDFLIPKSKNAPERLLRAINAPSRSYAEQIAFSWLDTKEARREDSECYVLLNDSNPIPVGVTEALTEYGLVPVLWQQRENFSEKLAA